MRYDIDTEGYITNVYFNCNSGTCVEYTGTIPSGYESLEEWSEKACIEAYKIVDGNLVFDENKYNELVNQWEVEDEDNKIATHKYVNDKLNKSTTIFDDNMCSVSNDLHILNSNDAEIPEIIIKGKGDIKTNTDGYIEDARGLPVKSDCIYGMTMQNIPTTGKNICPTDFDIEWVQGQYDIYGVITNTTLRIRLKRLIDVQPNTTYFANTFSSARYGFALRTYNSSGTFVRSLGGSLNSFTFTTNSNETKIGITIYDSASSSTFDIYKTAFENGIITPLICLNSEIDKKFEEYIPTGISPDYPSEIKTVKDLATTIIQDEKENIVNFDLQGNELCKIGNVKDEIDLVTGTLTKRIGKFVLDGSENWGYVLRTNSVFYLQNVITNFARQANTPYSNYFIGKNNVGDATNASSMGNNTIMFNDYSSASYLYIVNNNYTNATDFKNWLSNNPVTIYYVLETPETIQLEPTEINLYEGINNINIEDKLKPEFKITYTSQKTSFENGLKIHISNDNILSIEGISQSLNGLNCTINEDKSISLNGTTTADSEFILNGSMDNVDPIFMLSKFNDFIVSGLNSNVTLNLYNFNGTDRELIYSGSGGNLTFDDNKYITCATLSVASGKTLNVEVKPMITLENIDYVEGKRNDLLNIDIAELKQNEYLKIDRSYVKLCDSQKETELKFVNALKAFNPNTIIQSNSDRLDFTTKYFGNDYINKRLAKIEVEQENISLEVGKKIGADEVVNAINLSPEEINIQGNRFIVEADNFKLSKDGTLICQNATIKGSDLILNDDGTYNNAALKIKTTNKAYKDIAFNVDLNGAILYQSFGANFNFAETPSKSIFATTTGYEVNLERTTLGSASHTIGYEHKVIITNTNDASYRQVIYDVVYNQEEFEYTTYTNITEFQLPDDFGIVCAFGEGKQYLTYFKKLIVDAGETTYSSSGIKAKIYSNEKYKSSDVTKLINYLSGTETLTDEEKNFLDANGDGNLNIADVLVMLKNGGWTNVSDTSPGEFLLDTTALKENLKLVDAEDNIMASLGIDGVKAMTRDNFLQNQNLIEIGEALTYRKSGAETICGTWIDGKKIYRKVIETGEFDAVPISQIGTTWAYTYDLTGLDIDTMIKMDGCLLNDGGAWMPVNFPFSPTNLVSTHYNANLKTFYIGCTWNITEGHIILEYTKNE